MRSTKVMKVGGEFARELLFPMSDAWASEQNISFGKSGKAEKLKR